MKMDDKRLLYIGLIPVVFLLLAMVLFLIFALSPLVGLQQNDFILFLAPLAFLLIIGGVFTSPLFIIILIKIYIHFKNKK